MGEKTIVEAFKTFFERSVAPCIMDNNSLLN